jgi:hypothetical protein
MNISYRYQESVVRGAFCFRAIETISDQKIRGWAQLKLNIIQLKFDEYKLQKSGERRTLHVLLSRYRNYFRSKDSWAAQLKLNIIQVKLG